MGNSTEYETIRIKGAGGLFKEWEESKKAAQEEAAKEGKAMRFNKGKPEWSLVDFQAFIPMVRVLEFGAQKYARDNWKNGLDMDQILDSMLRHIFAIIDGQDIDPESGLPHIGHIQCNTMFYAHFRKKKLHEE